MDFKEGRLLFEAGYTDRDKALEMLKGFGKPKDGFVAFSSVEMRIGSISSAFKELLDGKVSDYGYMLEMDIWKNDVNNFHELYIKRDSSLFYYNNIHLLTDSDSFNNLSEDYQLCFYCRVGRTFNLPQNHTFSSGELDCIEVVVPETRLHIFITVS